MEELAGTDAFALAAAAATNIGLFVCVAIVLLMQPALYLYQVGAVSRLNAINDFYKGMLNFGTGLFFFQIFGWDILTGQSSLTPLMVQAGLALPEPVRENIATPNPSLYFLLHVGYLATTSAVISGASTGRMRPHIYAAFTACYAAFAYPLLAFTVWHPQGLLYGVFNDFGGAVVIHAAGAAAGLASTVLLRPRIGFNGYDPIGMGREQLFRVAKRHAPHSIPMSVLGGVTIWVCFMGLTCGAYFAHHAPILAGEGADAFEKLFTDFSDVARTTFIAGVGSGAMVLWWQVGLNQFRDVIYMLSAVIAGSVAVSAGADRFTPNEALIVGFGVGLIFIWMTGVYRRLNVDDPVGSINAHGVPGVIGVAAAGMMASDDALIGALTQGAIGLSLFVLMFVMTALFLLAVSALFDGLQKLAGKRASSAHEMRGSSLRISYKIEIQGIDLALHGQDAYSIAVKQEELPARKPRAAAR